MMDPKAKGWNGEARPSSMTAMQLFWVLTWSGIYPRNHCQMTKKKKQHQSAIALNRKMKVPELFKAYTIKIKAPIKEAL